MALADRCLTIGLGILDEISSKPFRIRPSYSSDNLELFLHPGVYIREISDIFLKIMVNYSREHTPCHLMDGMNFANE